MKRQRHTEAFPSNFRYNADRVSKPKRDLVLMCRGRPFGLTRLIAMREQDRRLNVQLVTYPVAFALNSDGDNAATRS